ncbi:MAG: hypothetical protein HXX17_08600 [Geobacteraceae bacterium]|nr:hypothetical protein [Geobacteraceae bacterium]
MKKATSSSPEKKHENICIYAVTPFTDCYCHSINSSSIPKIARYCMEGSPDCPVYEKVVTGEKSPGKGQ